MTEIACCSERLDAHAPPLPLAQGYLYDIQARRLLSTRVKDHCLRICRYPCIYCGPFTRYDFEKVENDNEEEAYHILDNLKAAVANKCEPALDHFQTTLGGPASGRACKPVGVSLPCKSSSPPFGRRRLPPCSQWGPYSANPWHASR